VPLIHPKSFVAGLLLLSSLVKSLIATSPPTDTSAQHGFTLFFLALFAALCIRHAFKGQKDAPRDELRTSVVLGITSLLLGMLAVFRPRAHFDPATIVLGVLYLFAAGYYLWTALRERRSLGRIPAS
jgi:hypothetical protein